MYRLIICLLLSGCVSSSGTVKYSLTTNFNEQGNKIKTTEEWIGKSSTKASGDAGIKASQKDIDFGINTLTGIKVHLKAGSEIEGLQSKNNELYLAILTLIQGIPNAIALRSLSTILTVP